MMQTKPVFLNAVLLCSLIPLLSTALQSAQIHTIPTILPKPVCQSALPLHLFSDRMPHSHVLLSVLTRPNSSIYLAECVFTPVRPTTLCKTIPGIVLHTALMEPMLILLVDIVYLIVHPDTPMMGIILV